MTYEVLNLDLPNARFNEIAKKISENMEEAIENASGEDAQDQIFLLTKRNAQQSKIERTKADASLGAAVKNALTGAEKYTRVVLFECADIKEKQIVPNLEKLQSIMNHIAEHMGLEVEFVAMGLRYSWVMQSNFDRGSLGEFAVLPLTETFTKEEAIAVFNEHIDKAGAELSPATALGLDEDVDKVYSDQIQALTEQVGVEKSEVPEVLNVLNRSFSGMSVA